MQAGDEPRRDREVSRVKRKYPITSERLMAMLAAQALDAAVAAGWVPEASASASALSVVGRLGDLHRDVARLSRWNDPRGVYAHCLCGEE